MLLLIAAFTAVLAGPAALPQSAKDALASAVCRVANATDASACATPRDQNFKPDACLVALSSQGYGGTLDIAFVRVGKDLAFVRATDSNGKVTVSAVNGTSLGAQWTAGASGDLGPLKLGRSISAGVGIKVSEGDAWTFDSDEEAERFIGEIKQRAVRDAVEDTLPVVGFIGREIADMIDPVEVREPDITRHEVGINANAGVTAGLSLNTDGESGDDTDQDGQDGQAADADADADAEGGALGDLVNKFGPKADASAGLDISAKATVERNHRDGTTAVTVGVGGGGRANVNYVVGGKRVQGEVQGSVTRTYDNDGVLTGLTLTRTVTTSSDSTAPSSTTTTTTVPIHSEADRRAVYEQLGDGAVSRGAVTMPVNLTWDDFAPVEAPSPDDSQLRRLLYDKGRTSRVTHAITNKDRNYGGNFSLGVSLGANLNLSDRGMKVTKAEYLGAPGADGRRAYQNFQECHS